MPGDLDGGMESEEGYRCSEMMEDTIILLYRNLLMRFCEKPNVVDGYVS